MAGKTRSKNTDPWQTLLEENSDKAIVYFFSSDTCGFCVRAKPYISALAAKYEKLGVEVSVIDVDESPDLALAANVQNFPQFKFVFGGKIIGSAIGWEPAKRTKLEQELGLTEKYQLNPGLAKSEEEAKAIAEDPNTPIGIAQDELQGDQSGCGDSTQQVAEIAAGMDEALTRIENKLKTIIARLDAIETRFAPFTDDIMSAVSGKGAEKNECECGKHRS